MESRCPTLQLINGLRKCDVLHIIEFYSAIGNNETMWFECIWMELEDMLSEINQVRKDKGTCFLSCGR
jgi:hypothetical protein